MSRKESSLDLDLPRNRGIKTGMFIKDSLLGPKDPGDPVLVLEGKGKEGVKVGKDPTKEANVGTAETDLIRDPVHHNHQVSDLRKNLQADPEVDTDTELMSLGIIEDIKVKGTIEADPNHNIKGLRDIAKVDEKGSHHHLHPPPRPHPPLGRPTIVTKAMNLSLQLTSLCHNSCHLLQPSPSPYVRKRPCRLSNRCRERISMSMKQWRM